MGRWLVGVFSGLLFWTSAPAQITTVELVSSRQSVSAGYRDGSSLGLQVRHERVRNVWYAGASYESRFGESGYAGSIALRQILNERWYSFVSAATSTDVFFLPRYRFDAQIGHSFGAERRWVATTSVMVSAAQDEHRDQGVGIGAIHYLPRGVVLEGSVHLNRSTPGGVWARRQNLAATYIKPDERVLTARLNFGEEAYQLTGADELLVDFNSFEIAARWNEWISGRWGVSVGADYYRNPSYSRTGMTVSTFFQFGR